MKIGSLIAILMSVMLLACGEQRNQEKNAWGYPRVIERAFAETLVHEAQRAAAKNGRNCSVSTIFRHDAELIGDFLNLDADDIVDFGQRRGSANESDFEILLSGPDWPETGIWLLVRIEKGHCQEWAVWPAIKVETAS